MVIPDPPNESVEAAVRLLPFTVKLEREVPGVPVIGETLLITGAAGSCRMNTAVPRPVMVPEKPM